MKKNIRTFFIGTLLTLLAFAGIYEAGKHILPDILGNSSQNTIEVKGGSGEGLMGKKIPPFNLPDSTGSHQSSGDLIGKPLVLIFWATWNSESVDQLKVLSDYMTNDKAQADLVRIVAVSSQEEESVVTAFARRSGYPVRILLDTFGQVSSTYGIKSLPTAYFVAGDGVVRSISSGILSERQFVDKIDGLLRQSDVQ